MEQRANAPALVAIRQLFNRLHVMMPIRYRLAALAARVLPPVIALHVSLRLYPYERARQDGSRVRTRARTGSVYEGTRCDPHTHVMLLHGYFDWRLMAIATYVCREGDTVVEVGANVGTETIAFADAVGCHGHVYAFEPVPANAEQLRGMLDSAQLRHVTAITAAVSDTVGTVEFSPPHDESESGSGFIEEGVANNGAATIRAECATLDSYFSNRGPVRLLVVDAEGAEVKILRGGRELLRRDQPVVVIEAHASSLNRFGHDLSTLKAELEASGYRVYKIARMGLAEPNVDELMRVDNWVALPPDLADEAPRIHRHLVRCALLPCMRGISPLARRRRGAAAAHNGR